MTAKQFEVLCKEFVKKEQELMNWKCDEYTKGGDRIINFKQVADFTNTTAKDVALMYLLKHIQSTAIAIKNNDYNWVWETPEGEGLKQRIADARNYLLLLAACIEDEKIKRR